MERALRWYFSHPILLHRWDDGCLISSIEILLKKIPFDLGKQFFEHLHLLIH